ncbi:MAG: S1 RNA-binding domain-containing protein, partial [Candidatus Promineifilaceae bacterium]|nr:S1 RNA-binding domain-containing protein [Candidatus Promineifilaceae bacterium]
VAETDVTTTGDADMMAAEATETIAGAESDSGAASEVTQGEDASADEDAAAEKPPVQTAAQEAPAEETEAEIDSGSPTPTAEGATNAELPAAEDETTPESDAGAPAEAEAEPTGQAGPPTSVEDLERKMKLSGRVERLELYGAFIDIGVGTSALVHISKIAKGHVNRVSDALNIGDEVEVWVERVDPEQQQIMVSMVEPLAVEWSDLEEGQVYTGSVKRLESFGAFVDIGAEREGLVHISELSHDYVKHPTEVVNVGDEVEVQILGFNRRKRRIDLSIKALLDRPEGAAPAPEEYVDYEDEEESELPTAMEIAMRRAMSKHDGDRGKQGKKGRSRGKRKSQDDILSRTLNMRD